MRRCCPAKPVNSAGLTLRRFIHQAYGHSKDSKSFLHYTLPRLQLQLAVIFLLTQSLYLLLKRFHFSRIVSEILAGIILGPTILGAIIPGFTETLFPTGGDIYVDLLAKIGYMFFMFLIGLQMDPSLVVKSGKQAWTIGVLSVVIPIIIALSLSLHLWSMLWPSMKHRLLNL